MKTEIEEAAEWLNAGTWGNTDPESEPQTPLGQLAKQQCLNLRKSLEKGCYEARRANAAEVALARKTAQFDEFKKLADQCLFLDMRRIPEAPDCWALRIEFNATRIQDGAQYLNDVFTSFKLRCVAELQKHGL
jgi:hypothetical protein